MQLSWNDTHSNRKRVNTSTTSKAIFLILAMASLASATTQAQEKLLLTRDDATVVLEPYAPNIMRVTLSLRKDDAVAGPGYGIVAHAASGDWSQTHDQTGDVFKSSRMVVTVRPGGHWTPTGTAADIAKFFNGSTPGVGISFKTPDGKTLLDMQGWQMSVPNYKDGNAGILYDRRPTDPPFYQVGATFHSPSDEHYYGLGQNQEGFLDRRGHAVACAHDYNAPAGQSVCVPFVVTNYGYGLLWDNPSKTNVAFGFNDQTRWTSEVGQRVSFFVIAGNTYDEIYSGYRLLTGDTPMLPKSAYGYIQCKQRYTIAAGGTRRREGLSRPSSSRRRHRRRLVLLHEDGPDGHGPREVARSHRDEQATARDELPQHDQRVAALRSRVRYYDMISEERLVHPSRRRHADQRPALRSRRIGHRHHQPRRGAWYWNTIRDNYVSKGFDSFWADETEPDLPPNGSFFHIGPGTQFFNVYPLFHTAAFYNGFRRDLKTRALILARDSYLGAQHNGAIFWSSDISPNWDTLRRQVPTGINFTASGMPYWSTDIGGWQYLPCVAHARPSATARSLRRPRQRRPLRRLSRALRALVPVRRVPAELPQPRQPQSQRGLVLRQAGRAHPRKVSPAPLSAHALHLLARLQHAPNGSALHARPLHGLPHDPNVANLGDEYMFGPALLVAPVTEQGATTPLCLSPRRLRLVQLLDERASKRRPDHRRRPHPSTPFRCSCAPARSFLSASR